MIEAGLMRALAVFVLTQIRQGDEHDAVGPRVPAHASSDLVAVHAGHADVEQHHVRPPYIEGILRGGRGVRRLLLFVAVDGRRMTNSLPRPTPALRASTLPPCSSTIRLTKRRRLG